MIHTDAQHVPIIDKPGTTHAAYFAGFAVG